MLLPAPAVDTTTRRLDLLLDVDGSILAADASAARNFSVQFRMCFPEVAPDLTPGALFAQVHLPHHTPPPVGFVTERVSCTCFLWCERVARNSHGQTRKLQAAEEELLVACFW